MIIKNNNIKIEFLNCKKTDFGNRFIKNLNDKFNAEREILLKKLQIEKCRKINILLFDNRNIFIDKIEKYYPSKNDIPFYCKGTIHDGIIYFLVNNNLESNSYEYEIEMRKIIHEFIHILYNEYIVENHERITWLDEGIAINFSKEKRKIQIRKIC